jgi:hypothetical protein
MRHPLTLVAVALAAVAALALLVGLGINASWSAAAPTVSASPSTIADFTVMSAKPSLTYIDTGKKGATIGDYEVFSAAVTKDGEGFGTLFGLKLQVAKPGAMGAAKGLGLFQNQLTFNFPDGTVSVAGLQYYAVNGRLPDGSLLAGETRAVVGGTGAYAGARGTLHTTAHRDGTRTQEFSFLP